MGPRPTDHMQRVSGARVKRRDLNCRARKTWATCTSSRTAVVVKIIFTATVVTSVTLMTGRTTRRGGHRSVSHKDICDSRRDNRRAIAKHMSQSDCRNEIVVVAPPVDS